MGRGASLILLGLCKGSADVKSCMKNTMVSVVVMLIIIASIVIINFFSSDANKSAWVAGSALFICLIGYNTYTSTYLTYVDLVSTGIINK